MTSYLSLAIWVPIIAGVVVLAVGRDYADAAPITGLILTPGAQALTVEVDLAPDPDI